jgi:thiol-disulfide isomerase/thioredoxin
MQLLASIFTISALKRLLLISLVFAFVASAGAQSGRRGITPPPPPPPERMSEPPIVVRPDRSPDTISVSGALPAHLLAHELKSLDKGSFTLGDFAGKILVVNLWASWCGPCRNEVPEYEKVRKEYAGRPVEFIALTTEDPRTASARVNQFVHDFRFGFRLGWADRETALALMNGRNAIPQTLVIASDGHVISHWTGYSRGQGGDRLRQTLQQALSSSSSEAHPYR